MSVLTTCICPLIALLDAFTNCILSSCSHCIFSVKVLRVVDVEDPHVARVSRYHNTILSITESLISFVPQKLLSAIFSCNIVWFLGCLSWTWLALNDTPKHRVQERDLRNLATSIHH